MKHAEKLPSRGGASSSLLPPAAHTHRLSHAIAKEAAPASRKIRIIHLLEPEVIKTEARHFRDLVQLLTGKKKKPTPMTKGRRGSAGAAACPSSSSASTTAGGWDASPSPPPSVSSSFDTAGEEYEGILLGTTGAAAAAAGIEMMKGKEEEVEEGGFLRALESGGGYHDTGFYPGLEDFFFNSDIDMDRVAGGGGLHF